MSIGQTVLVTTILDRIARECSIKKPTSWISATRDDHLELRDDFLLETVEDLLDRVDWPHPIGRSATRTVTSTDETNGYIAASGDQLRRLTRGDYAVYDVNQDTPVLPIPDSGHYTHIEERRIGGPQKYYRFELFEASNVPRLQIEPLSEGDVIKYHYVTNLWLRSGGGTPKAELSESSDITYLPRRLLESGSVWRFRKRRGMNYQDERAEYETLLVRYSNDYRGSRMINFGETKTLPWQEYVPSYIPDS